MKKSKSVKTESANHKPIQTQIQKPQFESSGSTIGIRKFKFKLWIRKFELKNLDSKAQFKNRNSKVQIEKFEFKSPNPKSHSKIFPDVRYKHINQNPNSIERKR